MKKFLSVFVALAMVLSLFAGVGARSAKAAVTMTTSPDITAGVAFVQGTAKTVTATAHDVPLIAGNEGWEVTVAGCLYHTVTIAGFTENEAGDFVKGTAGPLLPQPTVSQALAITFSNAVATGPHLVTIKLHDDASWDPPLASVTGIATVSAFVNPDAPITGTATVTGQSVVFSGTNGNEPLAVGDVVRYYYFVHSSGILVGATTTILSSTIAASAALPSSAAVTLPNGTYDFQVATQIGEVAQLYGDLVTFTVGAVVTTPAITLLTPTQVSGTTNVLLTWTSTVTPATTFYIYRSQTGIIPILGTNAPIASVASTVRTFTDTTTAANQLYYYWVAAGTTLSLAAAITPTAAIAVPVIPGITTAGTLTLTPAGNFVGGVDGSGAAGVDAIGTVVSGSGISYVVNVTTAGVGSFDTVNGITVLHDTGVTSIDTDWATTGMKSISFTGSITGIFNVGDTMRVYGSSTKGVGKVISINAAGTLAVVNVTTAVVGVIGPKVYTTSYADSTDADWLTVGAAQPITFDAAVTLAAGDILDVAMLQAVPGTSATAFLIVSGTPVKGDIATVTWQDTLGASHTVSYTTVTGDTAASVALALSQLIHALDLTTGNVDATAAGNLITLTQDVAGVAGNGKTLTATSTAAVTPTLTIHTLGGLNSPAYVELGKTIKLVAVDATGAVVSCTWTSVGSAAPAGPSAVVNSTGLVTADLALTGVTVVTATSGTANGVFAVVVIPVQIITSLKINLVPAVPVSITSQQFGAIASNAAYSALDYTTQAVWTDALPVASIAAQTGLLTYSTDETGNVYASAGGITATGNVKITTGVVTLVPVVGPVTKVIVLTIGSDIVTIDDKATTVDAAPEITNGRTFVPIRFIAETFGSTVTWLPETKGVTIVLGDTTIGLQIGNKTVVINGTIIALEAAPYIKNSRTMVPLRVISESFGGNVAWDPINHIITITYVLPVVLPAA